jgi:hypothetical protein
MPCMLQAKIALFAALFTNNKMTFDFSVTNVFVRFY